MQKKVGNALYVFDTTPFTITEDTNVEVIYVQYECLKGYLELNTELESKIKTFNQWVLCVNAPWSDGASQEPTKNYHLLTIPGYNSTDLYVYGYDNNTLPGEASNLWFHNVNEYQRNAGMIDAGVTDKIYCNAGAEVFFMNSTDIFETMTGFNIINTTDFGQKYGVIMGDSDMTVDLSYTLKPTYNVRFTEDSNADEEVEIDPRQQLAGHDVCIRLSDPQSVSAIAVTSTDVELTYEPFIFAYCFTMPEKDVNIKAVYTQPKYNVNFTEDSNAQRDVQIDPQQTFAGHNVYIRFEDNQSSNTITVTSPDVELTYDQDYDEYYFTMPDHDITIKAVYATEQPQNYHLLTVSDAEALFVDGYDTNLPPGGIDYEWFYNLSSHQINDGMLDGAAHNKLYCNSGAKIFMKEDIDSFETIDGLEIIDTRWGQKYGVIMGDSDMTVDFSYTLKPTYNVNFTEDSNVHNGYVEISDHKQYAGKNVYIIFNGGDTPSTITVTSADVELTYDQPNNRYYFVMPAHDVTIKAVYTHPIEISIELSGTDLTCPSYEPSGTYYPHAFFVVQVPEGKTTDNYTFVKSDDALIAVNPVSDHFDIEFKVSGTVTFANA